MNLELSLLTLLLPALVAGLLVTATHVPLGMQVLARGIVFIDLAIAQIAGLGAIAADWAGWQAQGAAAQAAAFGAALAGALFLTWTEKRWPEVQEATIGVVFMLAATGAILLLAGNPHGGEHLKDLLAGQILWVNWSTLALAALVYAAVLAAWFGLGARRLGRRGFYLAFAATVTVSAQLVGLYLVFATLIVPALATRKLVKRRLLIAYLLSAAGYLLGLVVSASLDLPSGAVVAWAMVGVCVLAAAMGRRWGVRAL